MTEAGRERDRALARSWNNSSLVRRSSLRTRWGWTPSSTDARRLLHDDSPAAADRVDEDPGCFRDLLVNRRGGMLPQRIRQAEQDTPAPVRSFARFLRQDLDAVTAGLAISLRFLHTATGRNPPEPLNQPRPGCSAAAATLALSRHAFSPGTGGCSLLWSAIGDRPGCSDAWAGPVRS
ncbi:hypothetical protein ACFVTF_03480 [Kitasatospora sp. NPDC057940]|uniref:hypothetical protein n=1 Tax=Kitasatospora sp. NPDC057940 TaxID=3346285 RepID=UPI0036DCB10C